MCWWGASAAIPPTSAASTSGSSATTCARARRRTPCRSPRSWSRQACRTVLPMIGAYASAALICAASVAVGQAILALWGRREFSWLSAPVGLAALVAVSGIAIKLPGHQTAAEVALVLSVVVSGLTLARRQRGGGGGAPRAPFGRTAAGAPLLAGALALLLASLPFIASGRMGILGVGLVNDDMAYHLLMADWI